MNIVKFNSVFTCCKINICLRDIYVNIDYKMELCNIFTISFNGYQIVAIRASAPLDTT